VARYATEAVPAGEACPVCGDAFRPDEEGVPFKADGSALWEHVHTRCVEGNVERIDWPGRLARELKRVAARHGR
jgi:hypothetical protein